MFPVDGRVTNVRLDLVTWEALADIARRRRCSITDLLAEIYGKRTSRNLATAIRNHIVEYYRASALCELSRRGSHEVSDNNASDNDVSINIERRIVTCIEQYSKFHNPELARIILEELREAGGQAMHRPEYFSDRAPTTEVMQPAEPSSR